MEKLAGAVASAQVDLNPHQVDAALFAFRSPLSKGALLADEVGLGKTIDAGLVFSQKWAERKRRVLIILPSNLRKQWYPSQLCLLSRKPFPRLKLVCCPRSLTPTRVACMLITRAAPCSRQLPSCVAVYQRD